MRVTDFDYHLPPDYIAQTPCEPRDHARLMVLDKRSGRIEHRMFYDLPVYLKPGDTLVFNDTRVIPARLIGAREDTGGKVEVFLLHRKDGDTWEALVKPGRRARAGTRVVFGEGELVAEILASTAAGGRIVRFAYEGVFETVLARLGEVPLPPYIRTKLVDRERYQTVYARTEGSAAAPTAGLHFTPALMDRIRDMGVDLVYLTLHVGLGTFRPVSVEDITQHRMHAEYYELTADAAGRINAARERGGRIVSVGTTAARVLETCADVEGRVRPGGGWTDIFIYPGYRFEVVDALITNFHLPQSTLLMLVSALAGRERILAAYAEAIAARYRFFSFGDAMLII